MVQQNESATEKSTNNNNVVLPLEENRERQNQTTQSTKNNESINANGIKIENPLIKNGIPVVPEDKKSKSIGHYILGKKLGEGTFGKVKLATHILTGEKVAIKILEKDRIIDVSDVERVSREIHILKLLRHSNIIQLYEIIETPKQLFLIMEYASGGELFDYIVANQRVKEREAARFFQQIISGIEYIHKLNIVHRDMKPENLLLNHDKSIKIVDFGLSNTYKKNELLKTACGSPCYAAPEMITGKRYNGLGVDIWSCGVILFALICGYLPFEDPVTANLYKKITAGDFTVPKNVSNEARDLLKSILNTDPQKRFTIEEIRNHPWCNQYKLNKTPEGIIVGYNRIPVDMDILKQLESFSFNLDYAQKCIDANKHNHVTTCYYLLLKKHIKNGGKSVADICSDDFDSSLLLPNKRPAKTPHKEQYGSDLISTHEEKENQNDTRCKNSVLNSRKESRDHSYSYTNANNLNSKLCSSQNSASKDVDNILNNNTAQLNQANQYKKENTNNTSMTIDQKSTANSKYPSYKSSKRNSIQTNKLSYNSENQYPNTTKPVANNNYVFDGNQIANPNVHPYPQMNIHSQTNQQSIQQQIIYQQQQLQQNNYFQANSALTSGTQSPYKHSSQQYAPYAQNNHYNYSNTGARNTPSQNNTIQISYLNETLKSVDNSILNKIPQYADSSFNNSPRANGKDPMEKLRNKIKETNQKRSIKNGSNNGINSSGNQNDCSFINNSNESSRQQFNIPGTLGQRMRFANIKKNPNNMNANFTNNQNMQSGHPQSTLPSRGYSQGRESKSHASQRQKQQQTGNKVRGVTQERKGVSPIERERGKSTEPFDDCNTSGYRILGIDNCNTSLNTSGFHNNITINNPTLGLNSSLKNNTTNSNNYSFDLGNYAQLQLSQQQQIQITQQLNSSFQHNGYSNSNINCNIVPSSIQSSNTTKSSSQSHRRGKSSPLQNILNKLEKNKNIQQGNNNNNYNLNNSFNLNNTYNGPAAYISSNYTTKNQNQQYNRKQIY
ncbi:Serine/Threonine kinase domain protein (macronuclear) [Tetrahymena thermophila SB210]|uniref:Serine/Threonine kinase domain protein n=1 Tax=Tetrahymena thermophila (strain SB210) TaxID=312017 RepID=I7LXT6_TETTS|nr:Serine/Threonine kinase domain protein [Tetrahymena thermophila SB210]EAS06162.2 Serine/Threonine kinase domain protein [Tetrahymena thermophila SB210]|eukprot:XP_001026407.2 Serine/Threonine kinase domain protein [Tetrahymena thermophila SB210]